MDAGVISFTTANPGYSLRFHTHWLSPPVPALALSGGPRKRTGCPTRVKDHTRASGRAWQQIEGAPISSGLRLDRDGLTQMLSHYTQLSLQQWEVFGITDLDTALRQRELCSTNPSSSGCGSRGGVCAVWRRIWRVPAPKYSITQHRTIHICIYICTCMFIYIYIYMFVYVCLFLSLSLCVDI